MKQIVGSLSKAFGLVNKNWGIWMVAFVFSWLPWFYSRFGVHGVVKVVLILVTLGWLGTKYVLLYRAYQKKEVGWGDFWKNLVTYMKKVVPAVVLLAVMGMIPLVVLVLLFTRWFVGNYFEGELLGTGEGIFRQLVLAWNNPRLWVEFVSQNAWVSVAAQVLSLLVMVGILAVKVFLSVLVVEEEGLTKTLAMVGRFLPRRLILLVAFVVLTVGMNLVLLVLGVLPSLLAAGSLSLDTMLGVTALQVEAPWRVIVGVVATYLGLVIDAFVLVYYVENREDRGVVEKISRVMKRKK